MNRRLAIAVAVFGAAAIALLPPAVAQDKPGQDKPAGTTKDDDDAKAGPRDPYTEADPKTMAAAGIVAYGPLPWADHFGTADVDTVLGDKRIRWLETAHFRIGCSLASAPVPVAQDQRRWLFDELKRLKKRLPKIDDKPKRLDPWLRLHLYAQRAEELYAEFEQLLGVTDADFGNGKESPHGKYLGLPDKYLLLLLQKKSDLARYAQRFCGVQTERSYRHYHDKTQQLLSLISVEGLDGVDDFGLLCHTVHSLVSNFEGGLGGFTSELPLWFSEGLADWFSRRVPTEFVNVVAKDDEAIDEDKQHEWPRRVRRRASFDRAWLTFGQLEAIQQFADFGFQAHTMAWSRLDYLLAQDRGKVGVMLRELKRLPPAADGRVPPAEVTRACARLLAQLFQLDGPTFDRRWREWVLKTYPKK
jgi:hypothetical protein